ncbi:transcriptional regulator [bacterium]|jgi:DNA-binding transcriptional ArsR family regulator|nr:transcriptional regulator [bacterium]MDP6571327.1 metalloregulator ArsR/SmtB family transcription factor [Patescibacteria group bacterium]MDP6756228.1 metalloregulator ArsR/SmtB family transcription factor [Patescibacteria group bacterium]|tara:strand:- start:43146 stop:43433 length:288 start_codon:yes stop_codon:yes gene_type:complete
MKTYPITKKVKQQAQLLALAGEPTRIRILCLLFENPEACVNEIADAVGCSIAATSHHLQAMKEHGLVTSERCGQTICYKFVPNAFAKKLKSIICE